jgi:hypothetical protein
MGTKVAARLMGFDPVWLVCCKGMLRVPDVGRSGAVHGVGAAGSGEEENAGRSSSRLRRSGSKDSAAEPSRTARKAGGGGEREDVGTWIESD